MERVDEWKTKPSRPPRGSRSPNPIPSKARNLKMSLDTDRNQQPRAEKSDHLRRSSSTNSPGFSPKPSYSSSSDDIVLPKHTDPRYLYVKCGFLLEEQLHSVFVEKLIPAAFNVIGKKFPFTVVVNKVTCYKMEGLEAHREHAYVYVEPICLANLLLGLEIDGKVRVEKRLVVSPILEKETPKTEEKLVKTSWADIMEEEEAHEPKYEEIKLPTLVPLPRVKYIVQMIHLLQANGRTDEDVQLEIGAAWASDAKPGYVTSDLWFNGDVPAHVTASDIKKKLAPFVSDCLSQVQMRYGKEERWDTYPCVRFLTMNQGGKDIRKLIVHFDKKTHDAKFVRLLMRHFVVKNFRIALDHPPANVVELPSDEFFANHNRTRRR